MSIVKRTLAALGFATALAGPTAAAEPVRLVLPHANLAVGEEVFLYAVPKALGFFEEEGIAVSVATVAGSISAGQLLITGQADIAPMLAEAVLSVREQGGTPKAFYSLKQNNGYTLGVLEESDIASLDGAGGKTVGFATIGSGADKMLAEQLRQNGVGTPYRPIAVGTGPGVITALRSGQVDSLFMWDAVYAIYENQGLKLKHYEVPIQDQLAGYTVAATDAYLAEHPERAAGFCRASAKALHFTLTEPEEAVEIFYAEFPSLMPASKSHEEAVAEGVNILRSWLDRAQKGIPLGEKTGYETPARWTFSSELYKRFGQLQGTVPAETAYTNDFFERCNDFDRGAIETLAHERAAARG